ncbi:RHS repeat-associated core domain-containing protein [Actinopolyspora halophila]|uniref:RHS repeat-associated core domain-containing protein n=1 Tax=Actinopolyspora halophila TaxID=1850 RepID=UPI000370990F
MRTTRRRFLPFGASRGEQTEFPGEKGFVGGTIDASVGLTTLGARQYDPNTGRFISVDPVMDLTDPQQMHGYTYGNNNPATNADPSGKLFGSIYLFSLVGPLRNYLNSLWEQSGQGAQRHSVGGGGSGDAVEIPSPASTASCATRVPSRNQRSTSIACSNTNRALPHLPRYAF